MTTEPEAITRELPDPTTLRNGLLVFASGMALAAASFVAENLVINTFKSRPRAADTKR